jgi:hypothetical protein
MERYHLSGVGTGTAEDPIRFWGSDVNLYGYVQNNPLRFGVQASWTCLNLVPGCYIGTPGVQVFVVSGEPTPGPQSTISGGYWVGGSVTFCDGKPCSGGFGFSTPGAAFEVYQYGFPIVKKPQCGRGGSKSAG